MIPSVSQCAGQQLLTGPQTEAYANHFIAVHLSELPYGGVYSKISTAALANPTNVTLKALQQTSFLGTTLRGLLLEPMPSRPLARSCSGGRSPRSAWASSWPFSSASASGTLAALRPKQNC